MGSDDTNAALLAALQSLRSGSSLGLREYTAVLDAGPAPITRLGNQSNLIPDPDPDLDSYYTMSLLVLWFLELQELPGQSATKTVALGLGSGEQQAMLLTQMLILEGRLDATIKGIESDYAEALAAGPPELRQALAAPYSSMFVALARFRSLSGHLGVAANKMPADAMHALHRQTLQSALQAWKETSTSSALLREAGHDELHGYQFGKPMAAAESAQWLRGRTIGARRRGSRARCSASPHFRCTSRCWCMRLSRTMSPGTSTRLRVATHRDIDGDPSQTNDMRAARKSTKVRTLAGCSRDDITACTGKDGKVHPCSTCTSRPASTASRASACDSTAMPSPRSASTRIKPRLLRAKRPRTVTSMTEASRVRVQRAWRCGAGRVMHSCSTRSAGCCGSPCRSR